MMRGLQNCVQETAVDKEFMFTLIWEIVQQVSLLQNLSEPLIYEWANSEACSTQATRGPQNVSPGCPQQPPGHQCPPIGSLCCQSPPPPTFSCFLESPSRETLSAPRKLHPSVEPQDALPLEPWKVHVLFSPPLLENTRKTRRPCVFWPGDKASPGCPPSSCSPAPRLCLYCALCPDAYPFHLTTSSGGSDPPGCWGPQGLWVT